MNLNRKKNYQHGRSSDRDMLKQWRYQGGAEGGVRPPNTALEKKTCVDYMNIHFLY